MIDLFLIEAGLLHFATIEWNEEAAWYAWDQWIDLTGKEYHIPGLGLVKVVEHRSIDSDKNYDGWYEDVWFVFEIDNVFYKKSGRHTSYVGTVWQDGMTVVVPKSKTIVEYVEEM